MILISGITGRVGKSAARHLLASGYQVRGFTRDLSKAEDLKTAGAEIHVIAPESLDFSEGLNEIQTIILVTGNNPGQAAHEIAIAKSAVAKGTERIIKISSMEAGPDATAPFPKAHFEIEQAISELPISLQSLRPNFFMQNMLLFAHSIVNMNCFALPLGSAKTAIVDATDVGVAAAEIAMRDDLQKNEYDLCGSQLLSFTEVAQQLSASLGREIRYQPISINEFQEGLAKAIPSTWHVNAVVSLFSEIAKGALEDMSNDLHDILGKEPTSISDFAERHRASLE